MLAVPPAVPPALVRGCLLERLAAVDVPSPLHAPEAWAARLARLGQLVAARLRFRLKLQIQNLHLELPSRSEPERSHRHLPFQNVYCKSPLDKRAVAASLSSSAILGSKRLMRASVLLQAHPQSGSLIASPLGKGWHFAQAAQALAS